jgi:hypothetical protein
MCTAETKGAQMKEINEEFKAAPQKQEDCVWRDLAVVGQDLGKVTLRARK